MRIGTLCFATERGLGNLAKSFVDNGVVTDVATVRHSSIPNHPEWYPDGLHVKRPNINRDKDLQSFFQSLDIALFFETPFDWEIIDFCRQHNVKTALMTMYECTPEQLPAQLDLFLCPSLLDLEYFDPRRSVFIPVPVDIPWRQRERAETFVHNAGYIGLQGRNGTEEILQSLQYVKSDIKLTVRAQTKELDKVIDQALGIRDDPRVEFVIENLPVVDIWNQYDVCLTAEKWNGLSLPLQEARANGMLVITTNRFPCNTWLPREPLIHIQGYRKTRAASRFFELDQAVLDPKDIALKVDEWYGQDVSEYSRSGQEWAKTVSWEVLKPRYLEALGKLL